MKKNSQTTITIDSKTKTDLDSYCEEYQITKKEFVSLVLEYVKSNKINIKKEAQKIDSNEKVLDAISQMDEKMSKTFDRVFAFIRTQETKILTPIQKTTLVIEDEIKFVADRIRRTDKKQPIKEDVNEVKKRVEDEIKSRMENKK